MRFSLFILMLSAFVVFTHTDLNHSYSYGSNDFSDFDWNEVNEEVFEGVDKYRSKVGLAPYIYVLELQYIAEYHASNMAIYDNYAHTDQDGLSPSERFSMLFPEFFGGVGENIAYKYNIRFDGEEDFAYEFNNGWYNSPGHRANMLSTDYNCFGCAFYVDGDTVYGVQNFGNFLAKIENFPDEDIFEGDTYTLEFECLKPEEKDAIAVWITLPDERSKYFTPGGSYYTGIAKIDPEWVDDTHFEVDFTFEYGTGTYLINVGGRGGYYSESALPIEVD